MSKAYRISLLFIIFIITNARAAALSDSVVNISTAYYTISLNQNTGKLSFSFPNGTELKNTVAFLQENNSKLIKSTRYNTHQYAIQNVTDGIGKARLITVTHTGGNNDLSITQYITLYDDKPFFLVGASAQKNGAVIYSNYFSPLALMPEEGGTGTVAGNEPRLLDMTFDNDNWTRMLTVNWKDKIRSGTGYHFTSLYDYETMSGVVIGNVTHDFWKTGIRYALAKETGTIDSLVFYGGAATPDNKSLPNEYGGYDGTHDVVAHGSMQGETIFSPLLFVGAAAHVHDAYKEYGIVNAKISGALNWNGKAPVYWNSFGVEDVLGYRKIMMPAGVAKTSEFLSTLKNFNAHTKPVLSIDSYDQDIYTTQVLKTIGEYGQKHNQQMGFYFIPFAIWTWKSNIDKDKLQFTDYHIRDVSLKDNQGKTIIYKDGGFGAFPLDPTHPATRQRIIAELQKAKAINAKFLKIDFLTAGSLESTTRYNKNIHSGMQAYHYGMKMLKHLIDSVLGPDIFITQAISPTFPVQFTHARFLSTDIYSHFRDDMPGFPPYGSTASSIITNSHLGWMQGTVLPYSNLDVLVMKNFQKNADLSERDIKVRLFSLMSLGSILGDGSDFRNKSAAERARKFLDHKNVADYFAAPKAFIPLKFSDGLSQDQQLSFFLPGDTVLISAFNFDLKKAYIQPVSRQSARLKKDVDYLVADFLTGRVTGTIASGKENFEVNVPPADAVMLQLIPVK